MKPISLPIVTPRPGGYEFCWDKDIYVRIERLREHHDSITAEFWAEQGEKREHILGGLRFSLVTATGRASMAKALQTRRNGFDWGGMLEQVCVYSMRKFREQEPFVDIGDLPAETELRFRLRPVLPEGVTTVLFGYGGMAKSTIATAWGLLVQLGEARLGLDPNPGPVLLLDWETNPAVANRVQQQIHAGMGLSGLPHFRYRRCRRPLVEFVEDVKAEVEREGIVLAIADSLAKACGSEKAAREEAIPTMDALGWLGITCLTIAHRPKGEEGRLRGIYGSVAIENDARQAFRVEAKHEPEGAGTQVALFHTKFNLMGPLKPIGYHITWDNFLGTKIETQDVGEMEDIRSQLAAVYQIEAALKTSATGQLNIADLAAETGLREGTIRETLRRYRDKRFVPLGGKPATWGLKARAETPEEFR